MARFRLPFLDSAPSAESGKHYVPHGEFQKSVGLSESIIEPRTFLQLELIHRMFAEQGPGCQAAPFAHSIDFKGDPRCAADRQGGVTFS